MTNLSRGDITKLAITAGFNSKDADIASAVAIAESGGNPQAHNTNAATKDDSYGLWQINYYGDLKADRIKRYGPPEGLFDPAKNAKAAFDVYKRAGYTFRDWTTFKNGDYKKHLNDDTGAQAIADAPANVANAIPNAVSAFSENFFKASTDIGGIVVALVLLILGVLLIVLPNALGTAKKVANMTPAGKVAKLL